jgi:hypothetical protein
MTIGGGSYRRRSVPQGCRMMRIDQPTAAQIAVQEIKAGNKTREV